MARHLPRNQGRKRTFGGKYYRTRWQSGGWVWSSKAVFTVDVPAPVVANLSGELQGDLPLITWDDDPNTFWVRLVITGNGRSHNVWYERDGAGSAFTCASDLCQIQPASVWPGGSYQVWMLGWGPGGTNEWAASNNPLVLPGMPQNISADPRDGRPLISWADDPTHREWVQVYIGGNGKTYQQWHPVTGGAVTCDGETCSIEPDINWPGGNYQVWMRGYAKAIGLSQWTPYSNPDTDPPGLNRVGL